MIDYRSYKLNYKPTPPTHHLVQRAKKVGHRSMLAGAAPLPPSFALRQFFPGPLDQGQLGSCTGHATAGFRETLHGSATGAIIPYRLSRGFPYFNARKAEGTFPADSGATMGDEFSCLEAFGVCKETSFPYDPANPGAIPPASAFAEAVAMRIPDPAMVHCTVDAFMSIVAAGLPIALTFPLYSSFYSTGADGKVPLPDLSKDQLVGGHGVVALDYEPAGVWFANSWSPSWGDGGYGLFPWAYVPMFYEAWTAPKTA